jgi:hypothetical protein
LVPHFIHRKIPGKGTNNLHGGVLLKLFRSGRGVSIKPGWIIRRDRVEELELAVDAELVPIACECGVEKAK